MQRQNELDDMINTTGTAFLGLTLGCARCHNHKFDPIRQSDYYSLQAIFAGVQHGDRQLPLTADQQQEMADLDLRIVQLRDQLKDFVKDAGPGRPSVSARGNEELFEPVNARFIRFTIEATNSSEPCIDELEVFSGTKNVALGADGAIATCSGTLPDMQFTSWNTLTMDLPEIPTAGFPMNQAVAGFRLSCRVWR